MDPLVALGRAVYLLDRGAAPSAKVRAFQRAAGVVAGLAPQELERRARAGTLEELPGIGATTGRVIAQALAGETPDYLADLERTTAIPLEAGPALREALRGDCHSHSDWSDGGAPIEVMARTAEALGHEYLVLTDHSARLTVAHGLDAARLRNQLDVVAGLNEQLAPFRILTGMEVDILEDGSLDLDEELLGRLDLVVASVHSKLRMERAAMTRRLVLAVSNPHVDVLGHCTGRKLATGGPTPDSDPVEKRPPAAFDAEIVFAACSRFETAVEINCRPDRQDPPDDLLVLAREMGCEFAIDSDAHAPGQLEWQAHGCERAARIGITTDEVINTLPRDELLAWAADHPTG